MQASNPIFHGLPHREPFVFVDTVLEVSPGKQARCSKKFDAQEPFFRGHFPGDPLVPGVILTEALAQTAGIAAGQPGSNKSYRLSAIKLMKFMRPVRPGQEIILVAGLTAAIGGLLQFQVSASVGPEKVAEGMIVLNEV
jgi:3-hydroxyacyl-[acyl-carrier-protein] dehydratase